jgi:hypothetical protein
MRPNFYEEWRAHHLAAPKFEESGAPPEKLLQRIWNHQRLLRHELRTSQGEPLRVLHPGFWNREPGPDFKKALIQIGSGPVKSGDIEIDLVAQGWNHHRHAGNPAYKGVILHVIWSTGPDVSPEIPTLALENVLDAPLEELRNALAGETQELIPEGGAGQCTAPLKNLPATKLEELLNQAAEVRLKIKAGLIESVARQNGWEQSWWEAAFAALGYKNNSWPMRRLAELLPCVGPSGRNANFTPQEWQARLLGVSNLLPAELTRTEKATDNYLKSLWNQWWRERDQFLPFILPREIWTFSGLRPANHPQRRIALASHWLALKDTPQRLEGWAVDAGPGKEAVHNFMHVLPSGSDDFWGRHWTFRSKPLEHDQPLIGAPRLNDLAINVVLPWLWVRSAAGRNQTLRRSVEERYFAWPAGEDNAVLKVARQRLLGSSSPKLFRTAAAQQGLIQITRDFCNHSNSACDHCPFPELVSSIK